LRVRSETGKRTLIVKVLVSDQIILIYKLVKPYLENKDKAFKLRTNFPNKAYEQNEDKNLKELGLAPSCALVVQSI